MYRFSSSGSSVPCDGLRPLYLHVHSSFPDLRLKAAVILLWLWPTLIGGVHSIDPASAASSAFSFSGMQTWLGIQCSVTVPPLSTTIWILFWAVVMSSLLTLHQCSCRVSSADSESVCISMCFDWLMAAMVWAPLMATSSACMDDTPSNNLIAVTVVV